MGDSTHEQLHLLHILHVFYIFHISFIYFIINLPCTYFTYISHISHVSHMTNCNYIIHILFTYFTYNLDMKYIFHIGIISIKLWFHCSHYFYISHIQSTYPTLELHCLHRNHISYIGITSPTLESHSLHWDYIGSHFERIFSLKSNMATKPGPTALAAGTGWRSRSIFHWVAQHDIIKWQAVKGQPRDWGGSQPSRPTWRCRLRTEFRAYWRGSPCGNHRQATEDIPPWVEHGLRAIRAQRRIAHRHAFPSTRDSSSGILKITSMTCLHCRGLAKDMYQK